MAVLRFPKSPQRRGPVVGYPEENRTIEAESEIRGELAGLGIDYERWSLDRVSADASADEVLAAYSR